MRHFETSEINNYTKGGLLFLDIEMDGQSGLDATKYIYLSVEFSDGGKTYYYRTEDSSISCGDYVLVPVGQSEEKIVKVVDVEEYSESEVPLPLDKVKQIIRRER